jgi:hypothetical protein
MKINLQKTILFGVLFAILALIVLTQANPGTNLPNRDYGFYSYIGKLIIKGKLPYLDVWESKPPAIFYLNALALRLGRGFRWGIWFIEFVFLFSAITASFFLMKKLWGTAPALFGIFVWLWGLDFTLQGGNYTEEFPLVFHFFTLIIFLQQTRDSHYRILDFALGLLFSLSFLFRPNNAIIEAIAILVYGIYLLLKRDGKRLVVSVSLVSLGILVPLAITSAYFAYHGLFQAMLDASIFYNFAYSSAERSASSPLIVGFKFLNVAAWIGLIGFLIAIIRFKDHLKYQLLPFFIVLIVGTFAMVYLSDPAKRNYGHYFMNWLPLIAVFSAYAYSTIQEKVFSRLTNWSDSFYAILSLACGILFFVLSGRLSEYGIGIDRFFSSSDRELRSPVSIYVENHTNPGDYVLFWSTHPGENLMSHRDAPHAALYYPMMVKSKISDQLNKDFFEEIKRNKPVLIVDMGRLTIPSLDPVEREKQKLYRLYPPFPPDNLDDVLNYISENYYLDAIVKKLPVYRLRGSTSP